MDLISYCDYLYGFSKIPVYLYQGGVLIHAVPEQPAFCYPSVLHRDALLADPALIATKDTQQGAYWGRLSIQDGGYSLLLGPAHPTGFDQFTLRSLRREYGVMKEESEIFDRFFGYIPPVRLVSLVYLLLAMHTSINRTQLPQDFLEALARYGDQVRYKANAGNISSIVENKEEDTVYDNADLERVLCECIEEGDLKKLDSMTDWLHQRSRFGMIASNSLRQQKNIFIIATTLVSRTAIRGGLPATVSYALSDSYISQMEDLNNAEDVRSLTYMMMHDFCAQTGDCRSKFLSTDEVLMRAINYIQQNTNKRITTEDVAGAVGFSRSWLSRKFKQELGFGLNAFINTCKLEEARSLLAYSDRSLSEISSYLCFSSTSHFHTAFRKKFGITPQQFRQQHKTLK